MCINLLGGPLWISINSQSYECGATLDLVKIEILESRGYFGLGGGLLWRGATLDRSSLTVQSVYYCFTENTFSCSSSFLVDIKRCTEPHLKIISEKQLYLITKAV